MNSMSDGTVHRIGIDEFEAIRASAAEPFVLDVREPFELTAFGQIPDVVNIPLKELTGRRSTLPTNLETPIIAVCQSGARSQQAARQLVQFGYRNVYSLDGGTGAWISRSRQGSTPGLWSRLRSKL